MIMFCLKDCFYARLTMLNLIVFLIVSPCLFCGQSLLNRASSFWVFSWNILASIAAASRLLAAVMAWMSPVRWRLNSSMGMTYSRFVHLRLGFYWFWLVSETWNYGVLKFFPLWSLKYNILWFDCQLPFLSSFRTCEYPPPAAPPLIPKVGPCDGWRTQANTFFFRWAPIACTRPIVVVDLPSPRGVGVIPDHDSSAIFCSRLYIEIFEKL